MLRFCRKNAYVVEYENLNRSRIMDYFLQGHINEIVCVIDQSGKYKGKIGFYSLEACTDIYNAIEQDYVTLDNDIWANARQYFSHYRYHGGGEHVLLPVLDKAGRLVCFAYEDAEANREIRMLRELVEIPEALQFYDVYPEYKCVKIYDFNELAYFFAKYLQGLNIPVEVYGEMWRDFFPGINCQELEVACLNIYAEGLDGRKTNWTENLLRSVSVEFECIDKIYEMNIRKGIIKNEKGDVANLLQYLKNEKEVIIYGTGQEEQDAYDFLVANGIKVCCFAAKGPVNPHRIFGKKILTGLEARNTYKDAVFIECVSQNSAWGGGKTDYYDYIGFYRNERFFLLRDYICVSGNNLLNALKNTTVVLMGDAWLCNYLAVFLKHNDILVAGYINMLAQDSEQGLLEINVENIDDETMCLFVLQQPFKSNLNKTIKQMAVFLQEKGIDNYTDYFSYMSSFINISESNEDRYIKDWLRPKKIVLGSIESNSGNVFFSGLLDGHSSVLFVHYFGLSDDLNDSLFWLCIRLSMENAENILTLFWKIYENGIIGDEGDRIIYSPAVFNEKMERLLSRGNRFTSQELFVMFHISYMYMCGQDIAETDIKNMVIYWVPQFIERDLLESCSKWLGSREVSCDIINVVRNACTRNGSRVKMRMLRYLQAKNTYIIALWRGGDNEQTIKYGERMIVRFEDLKCHPQKTLLEICNKWGIEWFDSLMDTTVHGEKQEVDNGKSMISGFDLEPVYNRYEEYLSEFDRMRIMLITAPWQRKYGYPYIEASQFSRRELQEMFLKKFRFEDMVELGESKLDSDLKKQREISEMLRTVRMLEFEW